MVPRLLALAGLFVPFVAAADPPARPADVPVKVTRGVTFATHGGEALKLDVAAPAAGGLYPALVLFHGGAWRLGSRAQIGWVIEELAAKGYVVVSASYRLAPKHQFPAQLEDVRAAVRFVREHAKDYRADPDRVGIGGFSAGAHLAMLAAFDPPPGEKTRPKCVVDFFGPTDLRLYAETPAIEDNYMVPFLGKACKTDPAVYRKASPLCCDCKNVPPVLIVHGTADILVPIIHSERLYDKLKDAGVTAELVTLPGIGHGPWGPEQAAKGIAATVRFMDKYLKGAP